MGNEADNKFTWVIKDFSALQCEEIYSEQFVVGRCRWHLLAYPKGNKAAFITNNNYFLSLYLGVFDSESLPSGWGRRVKISITIVNQSSETLSQRTETEHLFDVDEPYWGYPTMSFLSDLEAKDSGFLVNGKLKIVVEIVFLEVIGELDVSESLDVNGFHVLASQVKSANRLFERHPKIATKLRVKNKYLKSGYMNVLLRLTETLRQPSNKISTADLADACVALESLTEAGFELDWLKKKLDQVSRKKEKEKASEVRMKELEKELEDLKQKCSDIEVELDKEKEKVLAARSPPLADDF